MSDKEKYLIAQKKKPSISGIFSSPYMEKVSAAKALDWMHSHNVVFVIAPSSEIVVESSYQNGGIPALFARFIAFGIKASEAVENLPKVNPLLSQKEEFSSRHHLSNSYGFMAHYSLNYTQFIELLEDSCDYLLSEGVLVKRFQVKIDLEDTGKISYIALPRNEKFNFFLKNYTGEADLFDKSFMHYAGDLMSEYTYPLDKNDNTGRAE